MHYFVSMRASERACERLSSGLVARPVSNTLECRPCDQYHTMPDHTPVPHHTHAMLQHYTTPVCHVAPCAAHKSYPSKHVSAAVPTGMRACTHHPILA